MSFTYGLGIKAYQVTQVPLLAPSSPYTMMQAVSLATTNYITQFAAGSAINSTGPFTTFTPQRVPQIVVGTGGVATAYTITGTDVAGNVISEVVNSTGVGTFKATKSYTTITAFSSNINPGGTTDLQASDVLLPISSRGLFVGTAGAVAIQLDEDPAVVTSPSLAVGYHNLSVKRINVSGTAATGLVLLF